MRRGEEQPRPMPEYAGGRGGVPPPAEDTRAGGNADNVTGDAAVQIDNLVLDIVEKFSKAGPLEKGVVGFKLSEFLNRERSIDLTADELAYLTRRLGDSGFKATWNGRDYILRSADTEDDD